MMTGSRRFSLEQMHRVKDVRLICAVVASIILQFGVMTVQAAPDEADEIKSGNEIAALYLGAVDLVSDRKLQHYVNRVGRHLANQTERAHLPWVFGVLDTDSVNAFCAPGGRVLITRGLYQLLENEDELAGVLGHEIAHVVRQHHWKVIQKQKAAAALISRMQSNMKNASDQFTQMNGLFTDLMTKGLDKGSEFEADRDGVVIAARAGYDSSGLITVLTKLSDRRSEDEKMSLLFQTHPTPDMRIDQLSLAFSPELEAAAVPAGKGAHFMVLDY